MTRTLKIKIYIDSSIKKKKKKNFDYLSIWTEAIWREHSLKFKCWTGQNVTAYTSNSKQRKWKTVPQRPFQVPTVLAEARAEKWFQ